MNYPLQYSELKESIENTMLFLYSHDKQMFNTCEVLRLTGIRFSELNPIYWNDYTSNLYKLFTPKTGDVRFFEKSIIPIEYQICIEMNAVNEIVPAYSSFNYRWKIHNLPVFYTDSENNIAAHIFRHYYIRTLYNSGKTINEIMLNLGHNNERTTKEYLFRNVYLKPRN